MKIINILKKRAGELKHEMTAMYYAYLREDVKILPRILIIMAIAYAMSPIDLIPDFIPILGYLDDLLILPALLTLSIRLIPRDIMDECREKALAEPLQLKKNWIFGSLFIGIWLLLLYMVINKIFLFFI